MKGSFRLISYLGVSFVGLFILLATLIVVMVNDTMRKQALAEAESKARLLLDRNMATHTYFTKDLKPALFQTIGPLKSPEYFDPTWMSSTYAVRKMDGYFHQFNVQPYYYKECAVYARSPENEADDYERQFLTDLATDPSLTQRVAIRSHDGQPFFTVLRRGEEMEAACLRCHSTPDKAPGDLVRHYGPERSFGRGIGEVVSAVSIRVPLAAAYVHANRFSMHLSALLLASLFGAFAGLFVLVRRVFASPLRQVRDKAVLIAGDPWRLGETIELPRIRELRDVVEAFNDMSLRLKENHDLLEQRVQSRTADLERSRALLEKEIEERKQAEALLRESETTLKGVLRAAPIGIGLVTDRVIGWTNESISRLTGYSSDELLGQSAKILYESDQEFQRVGEEKYREINATGYGSIETKWRTKHGSFLDIFLSSAAIVPGDLSKGVVFAAVDITPLKRMEKELMERESRYRLLSEVAFEGIAFHEQGVLLDANEQFFEMFGYERQELIGHQIIEKVIAPESLGSVHRRIAEGSSESYEAFGKTKDGTTFPMEIRLRSWAWDGKYIWTIAMRDISRQKSLEQQFLQAQKMEAIGRLAGGVAHDFNNLLQVIVGYSEILLSNKAEKDPDYSRLKRIYQAGTRGADFVKNLLMVSRKVVPTLSPTDLNQEVTQVSKLLFHTIPKTITIDLRLSAGIDPVLADASQIGQVLMNLGINARDAMPEGGTLIIETSNVELDDEYCKTHLGFQPGRYVLLTVSDTGHGMDKETLSKIFEPFFTTKEAGKGTGLGLATVYGIVKQHQGYIHCYSERGHGTTFKIYLPAVDTEKIGAAGEEASSPKGGSECILLVDDEEVVRELGAAILSHHGYDVTTASNGREALDIYQDRGGSFSLVILDLIMPEMDGKTCLRELLAVDPTAKVLIVSGYSEQAPVNSTSHLGAKGFVKKPYNAKKLLQLVRNILDSD